jgi:3-hydroxyacyl-CoA dehydrogenase/enoyl-CoA hydratase/3-hydroxybutyryl-CoA epimerase
VTTARIEIATDAPAPGACLRLERPEPGLAVLTFDPPHRSLAVFDGPMFRDLELALDGLERDAGLAGVVVTGRRPDQFIAGVDLEAILDVDDRAEVEGWVRTAHRAFGRLAALRARVVAAIGGPAPGGACELALACDYIVLSDHEKTSIGLPETRLGLIPAWGGVHRLPKRIGVLAALPAILTGRMFTPEQALRLGLADRVTKAEYLRTVAADVALGRAACRRPRRLARRLLIDRNPVAMEVVRRRARAQVLATSRGHYPALLHAVELATRAAWTSMRAAVDKEAPIAAELVTSSTCKNLVSIFLAGEEAKKLGRPAAGAAPRRLERAAVVGAGVMGGPIASLLAERGLMTRLYDVAGEMLDRAVLDHRAEVEKKRQRRQLAPHAATAAVDRLAPTRELAGLSHCDLVLEAVAERLDVKRRVFAEVAALVRADAILATNTSALSVDAIAEGLPHPERVCGLHFFNPVRRMPLVEVVRGRATTAEVVTSACALATRLGKTPVVVRDVPGFLVNRCLGPFLDEALRLFAGGVDPARLDAAITAFGMPMGPLLLLDEVGLDIAAHAAASLAAAYGARMQGSDVIARLSSPQRLGKKTGLGFYRHPQREGRRKGKPELADDLKGLQTYGPAADLGDEQIVDRVVLAMVNEAARCLGEGVASGAAELDLALVFGTGFAPFRGGPLRHADALGAGVVVDRLRRMHDAPDVASRGEGAARFAPAPLLLDLAAAGGRFHARGQG